MSREETMFTTVGELRDMMSWQAIENGDAKQIYKHRMSYDEAMQLL